MLQLVRAYETPDEAKDLVTEFNPIIMCGVSASGKNSVNSQLVSHGDYVRAITHTTRKPRQSELDGQDYWFIEDSIMLNMVHDQAFVEAQIVHGDRVYGSSIDSIKIALASGKRLVLILDINGAIKYSELNKEINPLFFIPPSFDVWMQRLGGRDFISDGERSRRLHTAKLELETVLFNTSFLIVVNEDVGQTVREIIQGVPGSQLSQEPRRKQAKELLDYIVNQ